MRCQHASAVTTTDLPRLLTPPEAMAALRCSYTTLRRMVERGELRAVRLGTGHGAAIRIPADELERFSRGDAT